MKRLFIGMSAALILILPTGVHGETKVNPGEISPEELERLSSEAPPPPTAEELKAADAAAGPVSCAVNEQLTGCKGDKKFCTPGRFTARGQDQKDCSTKVLKLCRELCESPKVKIPRRGSCKCGKVTS